MGRNLRFAFVPPDAPAALGRQLTSLNFLARLRLPLAAGLLLLAYPPASMPLASLVAIIPLFMEAADAVRSPLARFLRIGFAIAAVGLMKFGWLAFSITHAIGAAPIAAVVVVALYVLMIAASYAAALVLPFAGGVPFPHAAAFLLLAGCTIAIPWPLPVSLAHGVVDLPGLAGLARWGGVAVVDLAVLMTNVLLAAACTAAARHGPARLACVAVLAVGIATLAHVEPRRPPALPGQGLRVAVLQPDLPIWQRLAGDPDLHAEMQERVMAMARQAAAAEPRADLVVLPEYPSLFAYARRFEDQQRIERFSQGHAVPTLLTAFRSLGTERLASTAILSEGNGAFQHTDKQLLFPFGEYLPGESLLPWLRRIFPDAGRLLPGQMSRALLLPGRDWALAVLICFDDTTTSIASRILAALPADRPVLAISLSNTESFGDSRARDLHLLLARYRAIETGIPLLRVSNDGHSGLIMPDGLMPPAARLPPATIAWRIIEVPPHARPDPRAAVVDRTLRLVVAAASLLLLAAMAMRHGRRRRGAGA